MQKISVIMSVFNEPEEYLHQSIQSVLEQSYSEFEFIIVLDNPQNNMARRILQEYQFSDDRILLVNNNENLGLAGSLNKALKLANGYYIARMDADDVSVISRFEKEVAYLEKNNLDLVGCNIQCISENGKAEGTIRDIDYPPECVSELLKYDDCVPHPTWLGKKSVFINNDGYKEDMFTAQDYDFLLRALNKHTRIGMCPEVLLLYRINTEGITSENYLRQLLTADYLQKNIKRLDEVNQNEINRALKRLLTSKAMNKYKNARKLLIRGIEYTKQHNPKGYIYMIQSVFMSKYIVKNIKRIVAMRRIKHSSHITERNKHV